MIITIVIPIYRDWETLQLLLGMIDREVAAIPLSVEILVVNDSASPFSPPMIGEVSHHKNISSIKILNLNYNIGNQSAIAVALSYIEENVDCDAIILMDGDGEDDVNDIKRLLKRYHEFNGQKMIFAKRIKRSEGILFTIFYGLFKFIFKKLTNFQMERGNYSIIPKKTLSRLVTIPELWSQFPVSIIKAKIEVDDIDSVRAKRIKGKPNSDLIFLIHHAFKAFSIFIETIMVKLLVLFGLINLLLLPTLFFLITPTLYALVAAIILLQLYAIFFLLFLFVLRNNKQQNFIPIRDFNFYVNGIDIAKAKLVS